MLSEQALQAIVSTAEREKIELSPSLFAGHIDHLTDLAELTTGRGQTGGIYRPELQ